MYATCMGVSSPESTAVQSGALAQVAPRSPKCSSRCSPGHRRASSCTTQKSFEVAGITHTGEAPYAVR